MNVKKFIAITTICLAAVFAGSNISAAAESGVTIPESFDTELSLTDVNDYAVNGGNFAFACGKYVYVYSGGEGGGAGFAGGTLDTYEHTSSVTTVEYSGGVLYFADASSTYIYSDGDAATASFSFTTFSDGNSQEDDYYIYYLSGSTLMATYKSDGISSSNDGNYRKLKKIDGDVYVLNGNDLYIVSNGAASQITLSYNDYETISAIATGDAATALKSSNDITLASVTAGSCLIGIDADSVSDESFTTTGVIFADGDESAQVLYSSDGGNAAIIAIGNKAYLTLKTNLKTTSFSLASASIKNAYLMESAGIYSLPFESEGTRLATLNAGDNVTVLGTAASSSFGYTYYKAEYSANGETVTGYIISDLLSPYSFGDEAADGGTVENERSEDNNITTIILVMIIVCLVLIAVGYVTYVATANERNSKKK